MANEVEIVITSSQRGDAMRNARGEMDKTGKSAGSLGTSLKKVGAIAGGFLAANVIQGGFNALTGFLGESIELAKEQARVEAQLNAVIASTGGAAGLSAQQIKDMASGFQQVTNYGDEAVIAASNVLLTFTNIGGDVFPKATESILDISAALGQDLQSSTIQVGKALNDPIKGVTALSRVGVSFTEQQKEQIRTMQEAGDMAGAQAVILAELEKEFKGSAAAAVEADGGIQQAENAMGDLQEQIGAKMIPIMAKFKEIQLAVVSAVVDKVIPAFERLRPKFEAVKKAIQPVIDGIKAFINTLRSGFTEDEGTAIEGIALKIRAFRDTIVKDVVPKVRQAVEKIGEVWEDIRPTVTKTLGQIGEIIASTMELVSTVIQRTLQVIQYVWERWGTEITRVVEIAWGVISGVIGGALTIISGIIKTFTAILKGDWGAAWDGIKQILEGAWTIIKSVISGAMESVKLTLRMAWDGVKAIFSTAFEGLKADVTGAFDSIVDFIGGVGGKIGSAASGMFSGITNAFGTVVNKIRDLWNNTVGKLTFTIPNWIPKVGGNSYSIPRIGGQYNAPKRSLERASGGIAGGLAIVGEQGRELVSLPHGSMVHSNPDSERMLAARGRQVGGQGGGVVVNLYITGSVLSERDLIQVVRNELVTGGLADAFARAS